MDELTENMEELKELLKTRQYTRLRQSLAEVNDADIAAFIESLDEAELLKVFRILPKSSAADVFSYLEVENQQFIITALSDKEAAGIIDNLMADDATDLLEEMPANIVKKLLANASPETRRDINHLLRYPEDSAGSIMTVEDHNVTGGFGSAVAEVIAEYGKGVRFRRLGLGSFSEGYGTYTQVKEQNGIGIGAICDLVKKL